MHPDLMREIMNQRVAERRDRAERISLLRALRRSARQRDRAGAPGLVLPPIPDYVDGSFRSGESPAGRVGAARE
jgi:hypothetical protein